MAKVSLITLYLIAQFYLPHSTYYYLNLHTLYLYVWTYVCMYFLAPLLEYKQPGSRHLYFHSLPYFNSRYLNSMVKWIHKTIEKWEKLKHFTGTHESLEWAGPFTPKNDHIWVEWCTGTQLPRKRWVGMK